MGMMKFKEALVYLEKAVAMDTDYLAALLNLAMCHAYLDNPQQATRHLEYILEKYPGQAAAKDMLDSMKLP